MLSESQRTALNLIDEVILLQKNQTSVFSQEHNRVCWLLNNTVNTANAQEITKPHRLAISFFEEYALNLCLLSFFPFVISTLHLSSLLLSSTPCLKNTTSLLSRTLASMQPWRRGRWLWKSPQIIRAVPGHRNSILKSAQCVQIRILRDWYEHLYTITTIQSGLIQLLSPNAFVCHDGNNLLSAGD